MSSENQMAINRLKLSQCMQEPMVYVISQFKRFTGNEADGYSNPQPCNRWARKKLLRLVGE